MSEEIDVVAASGRRVSVIGECDGPGSRCAAGSWTTMVEHKVPALAQVGVDVGQAQIVLFSRSGFAPDLRAAAGEREVRLVGLDQPVADLVRAASPPDGGSL